VSEFLRGWPGRDGQASGRDRGAVGANLNDDTALTINAAKAPDEQAARHPFHSPSPRSYRARAGSHFNTSTAAPCQHHHGLTATHDCRNGGYRHPPSLNPARQESRPAFQRIHFRCGITNGFGCRGGHAGPRRANSARATAGPSWPTFALMPMSQNASINDDSTGAARNWEAGNDGFQTHLHRTSGAPEAVALRRPAAGIAGAVSMRHRPFHFHRSSSLPPPLPVVLLFIVGLSVGSLAWLMLQYSREALGAWSSGGRARARRAPLRWWR